jgi:hypothetical protein
VLQIVYKLDGTVESWAAMVTAGMGQVCKPTCAPWHPQIECVTRA